jgi:hypothetical protein
VLTLIPLRVLAPSARGVLGAVSSSVCTIRNLRPRDAELDELLAVACLLADAADEALRAHRRDCRTGPGGLRARDWRRCHACGLVVALSAGLLAASVMPFLNSEKSVAPFFAEIAPQVAGRVPVWRTCRMRRTPRREASRDTCSSCRREVAASAPSHSGRAARAPARRPGCWPPDAQAAPRATP